ncbi:MAG TPA: type II secretion system F family protein [Candidatus Limnocylindrales bacterium]|nr:type II secretion system F family protein [Candidatus Limnocylindrales bacterium]
MPVYVYRAADRGGRTIDGVMDAPDSRAVVERLQRDAYYPIKVAVQGEERTAFGLTLPVGRGRRVAGKDLVELTQQLASLLEAGVPLDRALGILEELTSHTRLREITADLLASVRGGSSLSDALARHHPRPFSRLYINMVRAGEKGGFLEATLKRLGEFLRESQEFRETVVSATIYPALLTVVGAGAVVFLMTFVIPRFGEIFKDLGQDLPLVTQILLTASGAIRTYWWVIALAGLSGLLAVRLTLSSAGGRIGLDRLILSLPLVGDIVRKAEVARFARVLGTLLRSGVPVVSALSVIREMIGNQIMAAAVDQLGEGVKRGAGLSTPMGEAGVFPPLARHLVRIGEETGRLEEMLLRVADSFEADVRKAVRRLTSLLEPTIILVMGLLVGFIVVAMLLAIFSISEVPL